MNTHFPFALAGVCAFSALATACSCAPPPAPRVALQQSAAVFVGRVAAVEKSQYSNTYRFSVSKRWKGVADKTVSIVSASNSAACGVVFEPDREYLVYAFQTEGDAQLRTNLCTRTARAADAAADLAALGAPQAEDAATATAYPTDANGVVQVNAAALASKTGNPGSLLLQALRSDAEGQKFRVSWDLRPADNAFGTALYNRADATLKVYSRSQKNSAIEVRSAIYSGVSEEVLANAYASNGALDSLPKGVTKKDLGSKTVRYKH